ncbi:MAG TPA: hypothetical protein PLT82_02360 [Candidatus Hydrogenedens sp.]|nr:hypothetical protein [Candidatus Hydrogenedens sp.]HOK08052.1 hypothetical protein [Candidatus Hydrogenedens sp.]HOL19354.1 hypothetical protein [Candidatus Hydrogenedens sp.]HPP57954.1 hypothetical protein [Candidatus Hydrogenedens sp.]
MLFSYLLTTYIFVLANSSAVVEITAPKIPWFRSSEYTVQVESMGKRECPDWKNAYKDIEIIEKPTHNETDTKCSKKFLLDPLKAGNYLIPSAVVKENDGSMWKTSAFVLEVREPTEEELKNIQNTAGVIEPQIRKSLKGIITVILLIGILMAGLATVVYFVRKRTGLKPTTSEVIELPWEKAFRRLRDLKSKDFPSQGLFEQYYVQLTWILRYYIEDRFKINAPEQTTPEFIETTMKEKVLTTEQQKLLASFLKHCDQVKFAKLVPTVEQMESGFNLVWNFVEDTKCPLTDDKPLTANLQATEKEVMVREQ